MLDPASSSCPSTCTDALSDDKDFPDDISELSRALEALEGEALAGSSPGGVWLVWVVGSGWRRSGEAVLCARWEPVGVEVESHACKQPACLLAANGVHQVSPQLPGPLAPLCTAVSKRHISSLLSAQQFPQRHRGRWRTSWRSGWASLPMPTPQVCCWMLELGSGVAHGRSRQLLRRQGKHGCWHPSGIRLALAVVAERPASPSLLTRGCRAPLPPPPRLPDTAFAQQMAKLYNNLGLKMMERRKHEEALGLVSGEAGLEQKARCRQHSARCACPSCVSAWSGRGACVLILG